MVILCPKEIRTPISSKNHCHLPLFFFKLFTLVLWGWSVGNSCYNFLYNILLSMCIIRWSIACPPNQFRTTVNLLAMYVLWMFTSLNLMVAVISNLNHCRPPCKAVQTMNRFAHYNAWVFSIILEYLLFKHWFFVIIWLNFLHFTMPLNKHETWRITLNIIYPYFTLL